MPSSRELHCPIARHGFSNRGVTLYRWLKWSSCGMSCTERHTTKASTGSSNTRGSPLSVSSPRQSKIRRDVEYCEITRMKYKEKYLLVSSFLVYIFLYLRNKQTVPIPSVSNQAMNIVTSCHSNMNYEFTRDMK